MAGGGIEYGGAPGLKQYQRDALFTDARISLVESTTKAGKGQKLDATIYTPTGPRRFGDLQIGDLVLTPDGGAAPVVGIYPLGERDIYRITFADGTSAECTEDHLWEIHGKRANYRRGFEHRLRAGEVKTARRKDRYEWPRVIPLSEVAQYSDNRRAHIWIRVTNPVLFDAQAVPIDPYLLGALLGDGGLTQSSFTFASVDAHVIDRVRAALPEPYLLSQREGCNHGITAPSIRTEGSLHRDLAALGLRGHKAQTKFVPDVYRYNTEAVRWEMLRGLFDTDGSVDKHGQPMFEVTSERLARDVIEIVQSLGGTVRMGKKRGSYIDKNGLRVMCSMVYRCSISHPESHRFFSLPRKHDACRPRKKETKRTLRQIEFVSRAEAQCIEVDHPDGLYLTNDFIVTHNTVACLAWLLEQAIKSGAPGRSFWWVAPVYTQAEIAYRRMKAQIPPSAVSANATKMRLTLSNGSLIEFKSGERPDGLFGDDVYAAVLDEASRMREEVWHAIRSTLTATKGPVRIIGNVRGRKNWFYKLARIAEAGDPDMTYARITAWEAAQAGVIDKSEVEAARRDFERLGKLDVFRELYLAEAADDSANPFGLQAIENCLAPLSKAPSRVAGIDLAGRGAKNVTEQADRANLDYTAIVMLDREGFATHVERFKSPNAEAMQRIEVVVGRVPSLADTTGSGDVIVEMLQRSGRVNMDGYVFNPRTRQDLLEHLAVKIQNEEVHFPDGNLRDELDAFEFDYTPSGVRYSCAGPHDDETMALALAAFKLPKRKQSGAPMGIAGASRWNSDPSAEAWRKYAETTKPTQSPPADAVPGADKPVSVPIVITGSGSGKWR